MNTTTTAQLRPGDRLPNGALVLHATEFHGEGVVLAYTGGVQPFVTWGYRAGHPESTGAGHYANDLLDAVLDYQERGGKTFEQHVDDSGWHRGTLTVCEVCPSCMADAPHGTCRYCIACCPTHG